MEKFYMVLVGRDTVCKSATIEEARRQAAIMSLKQGGDSVIILEAIESVTADPKAEIVPIIAK